jgi:hypothetical protein
MKPDIRNNAKIDSRLFQDIINYIKTRIVGGPGIRVNTMGNQITISTFDKIKVAGGVGAAKEELLRVGQLPPIPSGIESNKKKVHRVFWLSPETGLQEGINNATGNDGIWINTWPQNRWYPIDKATGHSGVPYGI